MKSGGEQFSEHSSASSLVDSDMQHQEFVGGRRCNDVIIERCNTVVRLLHMRFARSVPAETRSTKSHQKLHTSAMCWHIQGMYSAQHRFTRKGKGLPVSYVETQHRPTVTHTRHKDSTVMITKTTD